MPKLHQQQQFASRCERFSPASVHNSLLRAPRLLGPSRRGLPRQRHGTALAGCCQPLAQRAAGTALRRQGRAVARAESPRHHRPWLHHEIHRRGDAAAASRPPQARARVVIKVCLSAPEGWSSPRPLGFLSTRASAYHGELSRSVCVWPSAGLPSSLHGFAM